MTTCLVGLGSNLDHPAQQLTRAIAALDALSATTVDKVSSFYQSAPQGPQDQDHFINAVVRLTTQLAPADLLLKLQAIEQTMGRVKTRRWGERVIDLDILFFGTERISHNQPALEIPHPHALSRDFVLIPALEIAPDWRLPDGSALADWQDHCLQHDLVKLP